MNITSYCQLTALLLILFTTFFLSAQISLAQTNETRYLKVDYWAVPETGSAEYIDVETTLWKPLHQERLDRGIIKSWNFYEVMVGRKGVQYDYVTINIFDDFGMIDYFDLDDIISTVYPDMDRDELMNRTLASRSNVHTEIWRVEGTVTGGDSENPGGEYVTVNFMDASEGTGEFRKMEFDFWWAIHELRVERDILNSWAMYSLVFPEGTSRNYTYFTIDYYDRLGDIEEPVGMPLARIAHPDKSDEGLSNLFKKTGDARSVYKVELWKRVDFIINPESDR